MRRHPLAGRSSRVLGSIFSAALLAGCLTTARTSTATPLAAVGVTISTGPGERLAFEPAATTLQTAGPITLTFRNGSSLPHNMTFTAGLTAATQTIVKPGSSDQLLLVPPGPGTYAFVCTIHVGMAGTLIIQSPSPGG